MGRKKNKKRNNRRGEVSKPPKKNDNKIFFDEVAVSSEEAGPAIPVGTPNLADIIPDQSNSTKSEDGQPERDMKTNEAIAQDGVPGDGEAQLDGELSAVDGTPEKSDARVAILQLKPDETLDSKQSSVSAKEEKLSNSQNGAIVDEDNAQCKFETSINEESLNSFLDIPGSSRKCEVSKSEDMREESTAFQKAEDKECTETKSEEVQADEDRAAMMKRVSNQTAKTADSYHTAEGIIQDAVPVQSGEPSEQTGAQKKLGSDSEEVAFHDVESNVAISPDSRVSAEGGASDGTHEDQPCTEKSVSDKEREADGKAVPQVRGARESEHSPRLVAEGRKVEKEELPLKAGWDSSRKNTLKKVKSCTRTHATTGTRASVTETFEFDSSLNRQKQAHPERTSRYLKRQREVSRKSLKGHPSQRRNETPSRTPANRGCRTRSKKGTKGPEDIREQEHSSSAKKFDKKSDNTCAANARNGSHSRKHSSDSARGTNQESRAPSELKRRSDSTGRSVKHSLGREAGKRTVVRAKSSKDNRIAPITFSAKDGICIDENALNQIEHCITNEIQKVVDVVAKEIERKSQKGTRKCGWKFIFFGRRY